MLKLSGIARSTYYYHIKQQDKDKYASEKADILDERDIDIGKCILNETLPLNKVQKNNDSNITFDFDAKKLFIVSHKQLVSLDIYSLNEHLENDEATVCYMDVVTLNNAKHLPVDCKAKNGSKIVFDIFPKERPHRYLPHVMASCCGETIRIEFKDKAKVLGKQHFSGNNATNERIAVRFVDENREYFMCEWNRIVEAQYK